MTKLFQAKLWTSTQKFQI